MNHFPIKCLSRVVRHFYLIDALENHHESEFPALAHKHVKTGNSRFSGLE